MPAARYWRLTGMAAHGRGDVELSELQAYEGGVGDPNFASVVLLLRGNGPNGSTTFTDSSAGARTVTRVGTAQISSAQSKFGGSSIRFDGGNGYLSVANDASLQFGTGDFTVEFWHYPVSRLQQYPRIFGNGTYAANYLGIYPGHQDADQAKYSIAIGNVTFPAIASTSNIVYGQWAHLALTRSGNTFRFFIDGVLQGTFTSSVHMNGNAGELFFGGSPNSLNNNDCFIDELRITRGVARYTANFVPPAAQFPDVAGSGGASAPVVAVPTITCSAPIVSGAVANLTDGNLATALRLDPRLPAAALVLDFGASASPDLAAVRLGSAADRARFLARCDLQYSIDGTTWVQSAALGQFPWPGANALTADPASAAGDPNFASVTALLPMDAGFQDVSSLAQSITVLNGAPTISTAIKKYGAGAGEFRRTGAILVPAGMDFGAGDFTVECWAFWNTASGSQQYGLFQLCTAAGYSISQNSLAVFADTGGRFGFYAAGYRSTAVTIQTGVWMHIAITRSAGTIRCFVDGANILTASSNFFFTGAAGVIGGYYDSSYNADALIDDFRVTKGLARYTTNFTPPTVPHPATANSAFEAPTLGGIEDASPLLIAGDTVAGATVAGMPPREALRDLEDFGAFRIVGTVKEKALPSNVPLRRRVQLFDQVGGRLVREAWSDAATGAYAFHGIRGDRRYFVVAFDHTESYRAVIADNLTPEPMP